MAICKHRPERIPYFSLKWAGFWLQGTELKEVSHWESPAIYQGVWKLILQDTVILPRVWSSSNVGFCPQASSLVVTRCLLQLQSSHTLLEQEASLLHLFFLIREESFSQKSPQPASFQLGFPLEQDSIFELLSGKFWKVLLFLPSPTSPQQAGLVCWLMSLWKCVETMSESLALCFRSLDQNRLPGMGKRRETEERCGEGWPHPPGSPLANESGSVAEMGEPVC